MSSSRWGYLVLSMDLDRMREIAAAIRQVANEVQTPEISDKMYRYPPRLPLVPHIATTGALERVLQQTDGLSRSRGDHNRRSVERLERLARELDDVVVSVRAADRLQW